MSTEHLLAAIDKKLFETAALTAIVGNNIAFARGAISDTWPLVTYFNVSDTVAYLVDYEKCTVQVSLWALDKYTALRMKEIVRSVFIRFRGKVTLSGGTVDINWTELIDSGALPAADPQLYGEYLRFTFKYRGTNLGGY